MSGNEGGPGHKCGYLFTKRNAGGAITARPLVISVITEMELLSFHGLSKEQREWLHQFIDTIGLIGLESNIKSRAIELRKEHRLKVPDAIIVASAIENDLQLVSLDKGMAKISGLRIYPIKLVTR